VCPACLRAAERYWIERVSHADDMNATCIFKFTHSQVMVLRFGIRRGIGTR
jgi:hypothetical protein